MFSFQTLLKETFNLLTCHLQFSITARDSMILKSQSVQSLSDHKAARTFSLSQERGIFEQMVWSGTKWSFSLVWSRWGGREESEWDWGENQKIRLKNTKETIKYDRKNKRKNKNKKTRKKKVTVSQSKSSWKVSTTKSNPFLLINNKAPKVLDAQVEYTP